MHYIISYRFAFLHENALVRTENNPQVPPELPPALNRNCSAELTFVLTTTRRAGALTPGTTLTDVACKEAAWLSKTVPLHINVLKTFP